MAAPIKAAIHKNKSVPWRQDPDILNRLAIVANLMIGGAKVPQIAEALDMNIRTASRDIARVRELWRKAAEQTIEDRRAASLATYNEVKTRLWEEYRRLKTSDKSVVNVLAQIASVEGEITKIEGTRIQTIDLTTKGEQIVDPRSLSDDILFARLAQIQSAPSGQG
jgi:hypothetical protein